MARESALTAKYVAAIGGIAGFIYILFSYQFGLYLKLDAISSSLTIALATILMLYIFISILPNQCKIKLFTNPYKTDIYCNSTLLLTLFLSCSNAFIALNEYLSVPTDVDHIFNFICPVSLFLFYLVLYFVNRKYTSKFLLYIFGTIYVSLSVERLFHAENIEVFAVNSINIICVVVIIVLSYYFLTLKSFFYFQVLNLPIEPDRVNKQHNDEIESLYVVCAYKDENGSRSVLYENEFSETFYVGNLGEKVVNTVHTVNDLDFYGQKSLSDQLIARSSHKQNIGF